MREGIEQFLIGLRGIRAPATCDWYRFILAHLCEDIGDLEIKEVSLDHLRRWRSRLFDQYDSIASIRDHLRATKTFFKWLVAEKKLRTSPAIRLEMPKEPQHPRVGISDIDRDKMLAVAKENSLRDYALVMFVSSTLCRRGGVAGLHWSDVDILGHRAVVIEKGDKGRQVYFGELTAQALLAWREKSSSETELVFDLKPNGIYEVYKRLAKRAGVSHGWNPHNWRHAGARSMIKKGANLGMLSQLLGHADVSTTVKYYGTLDGDELQTCHNQYSWND